MAIAPPHTACLRCVFPTPPSPAELATCDTAGVLGMAASIIAAQQAIAAIRILVENSSEARTQLMRFEFWPFRSRVIEVEKAADCVCCGQRRFEFLDAPAGDSAVTLCGRNAIQIRPAGKVRIDLETMRARLTAVGEVEVTRYLLRCRLHDPAEIALTVFGDGRTLVQGTSDAARAKAVHARFVGA
jgi:adenylyltransferase/sulfurtransferase